MRIHLCTKRLFIIWVVIFCSLLTMPLAHCPSANPVGSTKKAIGALKCLTFHLFTHYGTKRDKVYFLDVTTCNAPDRGMLLGCFTKFNPPVKPAAQATVGRRFQVMDKSTGRNGVIFFLGKVQWETPTKALISSGYKRAGKEALSAVFVLVSEKGEWKCLGTHGPVHMAGRDFRRNSGQLVKRIFPLG